MMAGHQQPEKEVINMMDREILKIAYERNPALRESINEYIKIHESIMIHRTNFERLMEAGKEDTLEGFLCIINMKKCAERLNTLVCELKEINSRKE